MKPLCEFEDRDDAVNYYVSKNILAPIEAEKYVEENWEKTRK